MGFTYTQRISRIRAGDQVVSPMSIVDYVTEGESRRSTHPKLERRRVYFRAALCLSLASILIGCSGLDLKPPEDPIEKKRQKLANMGKLLGDDAFTFGGDRKSSEAGGSAGIGVNYYLWRASLDTLAFLPIRSADPFGGVILTEWYTPRETPQEQVKVDVRILDRQLRADGVRVSIFKQKRDAHGRWQDAPVDPRTAQELEEAILTRAREIKINAR